MNIKILKAFKELKANYSRTILVIIALIIGLTGLGSIAVSYTILTNDLKENFMRINPYHVEITSKDFDKLNLDEFLAIESVQSAEFRDLSIERIEVYENKWLPVFIHGVENFSEFKLSSFTVVEGNDTPENGNMLIERDGLKISELAFNKVANVRSGKGNTYAVTIDGIAFDPAMAPSTQDHRIYAYVDKETFKEITGQNINERIILRFNDISTRKEVEIATSEIALYLADKGIGVDKILIPEPNTHPHQWQLNTLLFLQGSIGLLAFVMSMILVWQLMSALLVSQIRQIGILKAIGASTANVMMIYILMVLILGFISTVIAVPLSVFLGYGLAGFTAGVLNFDILTRILPLYLYVFLITAGLALPILTSLQAIIKGVRITPYDAMNDYGVINTQNNFLTNSVFPKKIVLPIQNIFRRKGRMIITILSLAIGVAIFSTGFNVRESIKVMLQEQGDSLNYDIQVTLKESITKENALRSFESIGNVESIETRGGSKGYIEINDSETTTESTVFALPVKTEMFIPDVIQGRWLEETEVKEIVINQAVLETFANAKVGEFYDININGRSLNVKLVGVIKEFAEGRIYISNDTYNKFIDPEDLVKSIMFVAQNNSYENILTLEKDIEIAIKGTTLNISNVESQVQRMRILSDHLDLILIMLLIMALIVLIVGALGMASAISIGIIERTREIGIFRSIGATPGIIYGMFITEGMIISVISITLGLLMALPLSVFASSSFGNLILEYPFDFAFSSVGLVITIITNFILGFVASRVPAAKAIKISTRDALAYE